MTPAQDIALKTAIDALAAFPGFVVVVDNGASTIPSLNLRGAADRLIWLQSFAMGQTIYHGWRDRVVPPGEVQAKHFADKIETITASLVACVTEVAMDIARGKITAGSDRALGGA
jgi:hypothetical protein